MQILSLFLHLHSEPVAMEVVLATGNAGEENDDGPYRNEDVREWSTVDQDTGMHEKARVETDRWRNDTADASQSYGKMVDSRERNSKDGNLVQKARRQVEIFQSQGNSGRCFQIVKASQWSSSRAKDNNLVKPIKKYKNLKIEEMNDSPFDKLWYPSLSDSRSDLENLSILCRKLHDEAIKTTSELWSLKKIDINEKKIYHNIPISIVEQRRSNSIEDLSSIIVNPIDDKFNRDCKIRRSLQYNDNNTIYKNNKSDLIAERIKKFEDIDNNYDYCDLPKRICEEDENFFTPIRDNDFVKNDPGRRTKFDKSNYRFDERDYDDNLRKKIERINDTNYEYSLEKPKTLNNDLSSPKLQRKISNKTVVHLRNASSPIGPDTPPTRCINVTAVRLPKSSLDNYNNYDKENKNNTKINCNSINNNYNNNSNNNGNGKPVKKVEFCKTEIHFAPDSGKVNIVETDGKPPPTNRYRRKKKNNSNSNFITNSQKSNMPLVHFGDTSYERYIFGGKPLPTSESKKTDKDDNMDKSNENEDYVRNGSSDKSYFNDLLLDDVCDGIKNLGTHTTTVNLTVTNDNNNGINTITEDKPVRPVSPVNFRSYSPPHASLNLRSYSPPPQRRRSPSPSPPRRRSPSPLHQRRRSPSPIRISRGTSPIRHRSISPMNRSKSPSYMAPLNRSVSPAHMESHKRTKTPPPRSPTREYNNKTRTVIINNEPTSLKSALRNSRSRSRSPVKTTIICEENNINIPTYENVFSNGQSEDVIVYENCGSPVRMDIKFADAKSKLRKRWSSETRSSAAKKTLPKNSTSTTMVKSRSITPSKEKVTITSFSNEPKANSKSTKSQDNIIKKEKVKVTKEKKIGGRGISAVREHKLVSSNSNGGTVRSKKPVEVVYETAVYNMKNENLSKPIIKRTEIIRGPRLINELICGSKLKRSSDKKATVKSNNTSQRVARCK